MNNNYSNRLYNVLIGNPMANNNAYNVIGRTAGGLSGGGNFFTKKAKSLENAFGTTGAAIASKVYDDMENAKTDEMVKRHNESLNNIYQKYGYNSADDYWNDKGTAEKELLGKYGFDDDTYWSKREQLYDPTGANSAELAALDAQRQNVINSMNAEDADKMRYYDAIQNELRGQTASNAQEANAKAAAYEDYRKNNYVSQKINQDRGKFAGSAMNTLITGAELSGLGATPVGNAIMGAIGGVADELEENGGMNSENIADWFGPNGVNWQRAGQNALVGAASGAVTGALNQGVNGMLAKNGGNLFKGGNALTRGLNNLGSKTALGRVGSTLATGAARGAVSGAVGGATGAGLQSALNNVELGQGISNALQGAAQGAQQGAMTGATMAGANMAISKTPYLGDFYNELQSTGARWKQSGDNFDERLTNTLTSGDSKVGDWLMNRRQSKLLNTMGNIGNKITDTSNTGSVTTRQVANTLEEDGAAFAPKETVKRYLEQNKKFILDNKDDFYDEYEPELYDNMLKAFDDQLSALKGMNDEYVYIENNPMSENEIHILPKSELANDDAFSGVKTLGATPTTAKGWLKRAGERIVEDANNRGVGLGVKDVSGEQYSDDINNMQINRNDMIGYADDGIEPVSVAEAMQRTGAASRDQYVEPARGTTTQQLSNWDRLAQDSGYASYDDVVKSYMAANPGGKTDAGAILTWLDNNPGTWNPNATGKTSKPQTELYETLSNKTTAEGKLRNAAGLKLQQQYGTIDKPTAKATNAPETLQKISDAGFTKPADVERMADVITGSNGEVSKLVSNLVATAEPVNTFDGETAGQSLDDYINLSIQKRGLDGIREGKAVKSQINALMKSLPSHADGSVTMTDNAADVFKLTQLLDSEAANYEGRSGMNYGTTTPDKLRAAQVIKDVSNLMKDRVYSTVDVDTALTPDVAQNLKAYAPNNKDWANYVDNEIMTAKNVKDLRSLQAPWVRAKKIIDNGYMNSVTYGGRNGGSGNIPTTKRGLIDAALDLTVNSKPGLRAQAKVLNKAADFVGGNQGTANTATSAPVTTTAAAPTTGTANTVTNGVAILGSPANPAMNIFNSIGRTEGLSNAEQARTASYITDATQGMNAGTGYVQPLGVTTTTAATSPQSTAVYDSLTNTGAATQQAATGNSYFQPTGDYWTDVLGRAMTSAIDANDVAAFASLYEMYQDALAKNSSSASNSTSNLSSTQQAQIAKFDAAESAIDELETLFNNAGGAKGPIIGALQGIGGDWGLDSDASTYNQLSEGLVNQIAAAIGKTDSLNTEGEVKRALKLIPKLTDDARAAKNKLESLRRMLQATKSSYYGAYGLTA